MAYAYPIQASFSVGELSPRLHGRVDVEQYRAALQKAYNWTILKSGGLRRRQGTKWIAPVKDSTKKSRVVPFIFGTPSDGVPQAYVLEMADLAFRPIVNGGRITTLGGTPTVITQANPGVVTINSHGLSNGDRVFATGVGGMTQLNNREFTVAGVTANTFQLSGINTSAYGAFTSGGTIKKIVEVVTPYLEADLPKLDYAQSADTLTVAHLDYRTRNITRTSDTAWSIGTTTFKDGPYLTQPVNNTNGVTLSATNAIHPKMTSNILPSGTAATDGASADAYKVFDQIQAATSFCDLAASTGWYSFAPGSSTVCNSYWIQADSDNSEKAPSTWTFEGYDGANWVELDSQNNQNSWGGGEKRYFTFINTVAFSAYRLNVAGVAGASSCRIMEMGWGYNGDYGPTITLTFDTTANINDAVGFTSDDVGRNLRVKGGDGIWRYFVIDGVTSDKIVTGRFYGYAFPNLTKLYQWKLGTFREGSWPSKVGYYQSRRAYGRSIKEPYSVWLSKTFDFEDFGTSDPLVDDDGITIKMLTGRVNGVRWLADAELLAVGTTDNVRIIDRANKNEGFGATNIEHQTKTNVGAAEIRPLTVQSVVLYADYHGKTIREFIYDLNSDGYLAKDVSVLNDHLLSSGIVELAYQQTPDSIVWIVTTDGHLVAMTYSREQNIVGLTDCELGGTLPVVESVCCIPGTARDEVYLAVARTLQGGTVRSIEMLAPEFDGDDIEDAVFLDASLTYEGTATGTVTGAWHLRNENVYALANGVVFRNLTASATGSVTLPNGETAETITVGLQYSSIGETLPIASLSGDGAHLGRRALTGDIKFSCLESLGLKTKGLTSIDSDEVFQRDTEIDPVSGAMVPRTGIFNGKVDASWRENGQFRFFVDDPLPCTIRAVVIGAMGDP